MTDMYIHYRLEGNDADHFAGPYKEDVVTHHYEDIRGYEKIINPRVISEEEMRRIVMTAKIIYFEGNGQVFDTSY